MSAVTSTHARPRIRRFLPRLPALLWASLPRSAVGLAFVLVVAAIPLLPMPWTIRAAILGLLPLCICWPKLVLLMSGAYREGLPSIRTQGALALALLGIGGFAMAWGIAEAAGGVPTVAGILYCALAMSVVLLWAIPLEQNLFVLFLLTMPTLVHIAGQDWHDLPLRSQYPRVLLLLSTLMAAGMAYEAIVSKARPRAGLVTGIIVLLLPLAAFVSLQEASFGRFMFVFHYFLAPACIALWVSVAVSGGLHAPRAKEDRAFLSVLEDVVYRRRRIPGEGGALLGAEDDRAWQPHLRKRSSLSGHVPIRDQERLPALRACLGPPFAESHGFRFASSGLAKKMGLLLPVMIFGQWEEGLAAIAIQIALLLPFAIVLIERTVMYVERVQDIASGSESAELGLLPVWGGNARMQSLLLPALAKPILLDAGLLSAALGLFLLLVRLGGGPALFVPAAITMIAGTAWLLTYVCAALASPRLADWPPQIVALGLLGYSICLWPLHAAGEAGAVASVAGAGLALAACAWAAARLLRRPRPFFVG